MNVDVLHHRAAAVPRPFSTHAVAYGLTNVSMGPHGDAEQNPDPSFIGS